LVKIRRLGSPESWIDYLSGEVVRFLEGDILHGAWIADRPAVLIEHPHFQRHGGDARGCCTRIRERDIDI